MQLKLLKNNIPEWNSFLNENEHLIIHTPEWKQFIEKTFPRTKAKYYAITNKQNKIKFIFPIFHTKLSLIPNVSSCFLEYGGSAGKITNNLFQIIKNKLPKNIEIRSGFNNNLMQQNFVEVKNAKRFFLQLKTEEEMWMHIHKYKRKAVRLAEKSGIVVKEVPETQINELYNLYINSMKLFGTPPYSKKYFINYYNYFIRNDLAKVFGSYYDGKLVAFLAGFVVSNRIHININVSDKNYLKFRPNDAIHWEFIKWGCNNNYCEFDFGTVFECRGQFQFKKKWNAELLDLNHYYLRPVKNKEPFYFKFPIFSFVWKNLPTSISSLIGQFFREFIGI
jgi:hypothetical protein